MEANPKLIIKKSSIAGKGVFAEEKILKNQTICFLNGELCTLEEIIDRVNAGKEQPSDPLGVDYEKYLDLDEISRSFNHSCDPNTFVRGQNELVALKDIYLGQELTFDYSTTMYENKEKVEQAGLHLWTCVCSCGFENCRGKIDQFKTLPTEIKQFYLSNKYLPDFIFKTFS